MYSNKEICDEKSRILHNKLIGLQRGRLSVLDIGMMHLVDEIDRLRLLWKDAEESNKRMKEEFEQLEKSLAEARKKLEISAIDKKEIQNHMRMLMEENKALKLDLNVYEARERQLKEFMKNGTFDSLSKEDRDQFAFLREPLTRVYSNRLKQRHPELKEETHDDDSVDYDASDDSLDQIIVLRNGRTVRRSSNSKMGEKRESKKRSSRVIISKIDEEHSGMTPPKMCKNECLEVSTVTTTTVNVGRQSSGKRQTTRRSFSCGNLVAIKESNLVSSSALGKSTLDIRTPRRGNNMAPWTSGLSTDIALRQHTFEDVGINLKMSKCDECHTGIFANRSLRCKDCHQAVHKQCASRLHLPCVPRQKLGTPKSANRSVKREYRLQDFCTNSKPMIPFPVIHCVVALEKRSLTEEGLYRVPGSVRAVTSLLGELRTSRSVPNLDLQDTEVITETLKRFLRDLRDPLVPRTSREELIAAAKLFSNNPDKGRLALNRVICELPQTNRDTMAYLFLHWRKVISLSEMNKMSRENMSRVLGPCVMGIPSYRLDQNTAVSDASKCEETLNALFLFDDVYWQRFLGSTENIEPVRKERTKTAVFDCSILGPVSESPSTPILSKRRRSNLLGSIQD